MNKKNILSRYLILPLFALMTLASCEDGSDAYTTGITDQNSAVLTIDKPIAAPGDVVTITGSNLDQVYKVMLNTESISIPFTATANELKMTLPANAPLGDVITINLLFSGKGLAQYAFSIQAPPTILKVTPSAATLAGTQIKVLGVELYKAVKVFIGETEVSYTIVDDKTILTAIPEGFAGGQVKLVSASGSESLSNAIALGEEIMVNDFDGTTKYYKGTSNNGNIDAKVEKKGDFVRGTYLDLPLINKASSWGGNFDISLQDHAATAYDNSKMSLAIDMKASKAMNVSIMLEGLVTVYGKTIGITTDWQTLIIPFTEMGSGYGNNGPDPVEAFNVLKGIKIQPPATSAANNFGEVVSIDNVRFIVNN